MATITDLQKLGFACGIAHGSVDVEQQALDAAHAAADPTVVAGQVNQLTVETVRALADAGKLPEDPTERRDLATQIADDALAMLTTAVTDKVAFHERALQIAQDSPDVWVIQQVVDGQLVAQLYVACKADGTGWDKSHQATLDALSDQTAFAARVTQARKPPGGTPKQAKAGG